MPFDTLEARPLKLIRFYGLKHASVLAQAQMLLDVRNAKGTIAGDGAAPLMEQILPAFPRDGFLGEFLPEDAELRGRDGWLVVLTGGTAFVAPVGEWLAAARESAERVCRHFIANGTPGERQYAAAELSKIRRPALRAVS